MTLAGAYLGDGWARITERSGFVFLGLSEEKLRLLLPRIEDLNAGRCIARMRASLRVQISGRPLARWLIENFGAGAAVKRVPMWALGAPARLRDALLRGYLITDGTQLKDGQFRATTVSRDLALTMRALANATGYASSVIHGHALIVEARILSALFFKIGMAAPHQANAACPAVAARQPRTAP